MTNAAMYFAAETASTGAAVARVPRQHPSVNFVSASLIESVAPQDPHGSLLIHLREWFQDSWFSADALGAHLSSARVGTSSDEAPHVAFIVAAAALHELQDVHAGAMSLQASITSPGLWRVCSA